jgi:alanine-synthesizing transaminase
MKKPFVDPEVFSRVKRLPPYVFTITDRLRDEARDRGVDVIDLSMGSPDSGAPAVAVEALRSAASDPRWSRYQNPRGVPELRRAAAGYFQRRFGLELDPEKELCATVGSKEGIAHALLALVQEGDAVLAPTPSYPIHARGALIAGGETIPVRVGPGVDFLESLFETTEKLERRPRGILVNFPANPTTAVATPELYEKIVRFAEARDLFIVSDLAYAEIVFDRDGPAPSMLQAPGARERTIEFFSMSKTYGMAGWRVGFAAGNPALVAAMARVKSYLDYGLVGPVQAAAIATLDGCDAEAAATRERYRRRRDALCEAFGAAGWTIPPPAATMFAWAPLPDALRHLGSLEFARRLIDEAGIAVAPGVGFGPEGEGHVRIALVEDEARLRAAGERVQRFIEKLSKEPKPSYTPVPRPASA